MDTENNTIWTDISTRLKRMQFGNKAQLAFLEDLYILVSDGIPATRAVEMMIQVTTGLSRDVALSVAHKIAEGQLLAEGMRYWFSTNVVEIIRVGEESGALAQTMKSAINTLSQRGGALGALIAAISYPIMVITLACCIIVYLDGSVFQQFREIKPIDQWPEAGRSLLAISQVIQKGWWVLLIVIIIIIFAMRYLFSHYVGEFRPFLDKFPPFSLYRRFVASRLLETLGLLIANGVVFKNAIKVLLYQSNPYLSYHLIMMEHLLGSGKGNVSDVLATGLVAENDVLRLRVLAEVKGFEHGLVRMGVHGSEQNIKTVHLISKIAGGALMVLGAYLIVTIVKGIYLTGMAMGTA